MIESTRVTVNQSRHVEYVWMVGDNEFLGENRLSLFIIEEDAQTNSNFRVKMRKKVKEDEHGPVYHYVYTFSADSVAEAKELITDFYSEDITQTINK